MSHSLSQGVSIAVAQNGQLLIGQRAKAPFKGQWSFAGGRIEPGEAPVEAAHRELYEETGLKALRLIPVTSFLLPSDTGDWQLHLFATDQVEGHLSAKSDLENLNWMNIETLKTLATTPNLVALGKEALAKLASS